MKGKSSASGLAERLKRARENARGGKGIERTEVASWFGITPQAVAMWESTKAKRTSRPDMSKLERLSREYGVEVGELLGHADLRVVRPGEEFPPDPDDVPPTIGSVTGVRGIPADASPQIDVTGGLGSGGLTILNPSVPGGPRHGEGMTFGAENIADYWRLPPVLLSAMRIRPHDLAIFPVQGDSMSETLEEDDFVFVDTRHRVPSPPGLYALSDEFGGVIVKRLEVEENGDDPLILVKSDNPRHEPKKRRLSETYIIGRVVRKFGIVR